MVQWSAPESGDGSSDIEYAGYADFYDQAGGLVASQVPKPCLFYYAQGQNLTCFMPEGLSGEAEIARYRLTP